METAPIGCRPTAINKANRFDRSMWSNFSACVSSQPSRMRLSKSGCSCLLVNSSRRRGKVTANQAPRTGRPLFPPPHPRHPARRGPFGKNPLCILSLGQPRPAGDRDFAPGEKRRARAKMGLQRAGPGGLPARISGHDERAKVGIFILPQSRFAPTATRHTMAKQEYSRSGQNSPSTAVRRIGCSSLRLSWRPKIAACFALFLWSLTSPR